MNWYVDRYRYRYIDISIDRLIELLIDVSWVSLGKQEWAKTKTKQDNSRNQRHRYKP